MAKISANGAREQARWRITLNEGDEYPGGVMDHGAEYLYVLRTDGVLLSRVVKIDGKTVPGTYKVTGRVKAETPMDDREDKVEAYLGKRFGAAAVKWEPVR
jgi:hypothetical protein